MRRMILVVTTLLALAAGDSAARDATPVEFIPADTVLELQRAGRVRLIVDVRGPEEFEAVHVRGAVNIPLGDLERRSREIPREGLVVLY